MKMLLTAAICLMLGLTFGLGLTGCGGSGAAMPGKPILSSPTPPPRITEYAISTPNSIPLGITVGPDGNLWFAEHICAFACGNPPWGKIARITPGGTIAEFDMTPAPLEITTGPDGNLWFTTTVDTPPSGRFGHETCSSSVGSITTSGGAGQQFQTYSGNGSCGIGLAKGPDGDLWFTEPATNSVGKITTSGAITKFPIPTAGSEPRGITAGPDGNLWFTEASGNNVARITTTGAITEFPTATGSGATSITKGPDGNLWFTEYNADKIGRITTTGAITEFPIPVLADGATKPGGITAGPDGNLWFTENGPLPGSDIDQITTGGAITAYPIPTAWSGAFCIVAGPDGNLWFTETSANKVGKFTLKP